MDPVNENHTSFGYVGNNPILLIDPNGIKSDGPLDWLMSGINSIKQTWANFMDGFSSKSNVVQKNVAPLYGQQLGNGVRMFDGSYMGVGLQLETTIAGTGGYTIGFDFVASKDQAALFSTTGIGIGLDASVPGCMFVLYSNMDNVRRFSVSDFAGVGDSYSAGYGIFTGSCFRDLELKDGSTGNLYNGLSGGISIETPY